PPSSLLLSVLFVVGKTGAAENLLQPLALLAVLPPAHGVEALTAAPLSLSVELPEARRRLRPSIRRPPRPEVPAPPTCLAPVGVPPLRGIPVCRRAAKQGEEAQ